MGKFEKTVMSAMEDGQDWVKALLALAQKLDSLTQLPAEVMADDLVDTYLAGLAARRA